VENTSDEYLDKLILSRSSDRQLKVALIFVRVMQACQADGRAVSDDKFDERLRYLVDSGKLEAFGNIANWRFSEVRLKAPTDANSQLEKSK
jgi:uncharacterized protein DUF3658